MNSAATLPTSSIPNANPPQLVSGREFDRLYHRASGLRTLLTERLDQLNETPMSDPAFALLEAGCTALSHEAELAADLFAEVAAVTEDDRRAKAALVLQWATLADDGRDALASSLARDVLGTAQH